MEDESSVATTQTQIVEVLLPDGTTFYVQAKALGGEADVSIKSAPFDKVAKAIEGVAQTLTATWKKVEPSKASVEFNVEFAWESGDLMAMFVNSSATASMKITLEWSKAQADS